MSDMPHSGVERILQYVVVTQLAIGSEIGSETSSGTGSSEQALRMRIRERDEECSIKKLPVIAR